MTGLHPAWLWWHCRPPGCVLTLAAWPGVACPHSVTSTASLAPGDGAAINGRLSLTNLALGTLCGKSHPAVPKPGFPHPLSL